MTMPLTRAGTVAAELRGLILSGEFPPGTKLRQAAIAERFGVSTTPVREAFTALAREGIVKQDAHRGVIVFSASPDDIRENYEIRVALEVLATELAAKRIDDGSLKELDELLVVMSDKIRTDPEYHTEVLNPRFHAQIYASAGRPKLAGMIENLRQSAIAYQALLVNRELSPEYLDAVQAEHQEIVDALRARAPKRAGKATRLHIEHGMNQILGLMGSQKAVSPEVA
jgi:DNA-binding GntR family transcriptional regulator